MQFINNQLSEYSRMHTNAILGINSCRPVKECQGNAVSLVTPNSMRVARSKLTFIL